MDDEVRQRLEAVERAVTEGETDLSALADGAATADRVTDIEDEVADLTDRLDELEASTQAVRGYVGEVRSVNREVEQTAERALAEVERLRDAGIPEDDGRSGSPDRPDEPTEAATRSGETPADSRHQERTGSSPTGGRDKNQGQRRAGPPRDGAPAGTGSTADAGTMADPYPPSQSGPTAADPTDGGHRGSDPDHSCPACGRPEPATSNGRNSAGDGTSTTEQRDHAGRDLGLGDGFADRSVDRALGDGGVPGDPGTAPSRARRRDVDDEDRETTGLLQSVRDLL